MAEQWDMGRGFTWNRKKTKKNDRNGNENMTPAIILVKKKRKGNDSRPLDSRGFWQWASAGPPWKTPTSTVFSQSVNGRKRLRPKHWRPLQADRTNSLKRATYNSWILTSILKKSNLYRFFCCCCCFWVTIQISILQWKTSRATARHWLWQKQKAAASLPMIMSAWMLQCELSPGSSASS